MAFKMFKRPFYFMKNDRKLGICFISTYVDDNLTIVSKKMLEWALQELLQLTGI